MFICNNRVNASLIKMESIDKKFKSIIFDDKKSVKDVIRFILEKLEIFQLFE